MQVVSAIGLRERKKRETKRALAVAAQELVHERGLDDVTVEQIAAAADVSPRTFFNYFSCKEEAVVGIDPAAAAELAAEVRDRPAAESPHEALRAVLLADLDAEAAARRWQRRNELVRRYPALQPRYLAGIAELEDALAGALADRMGVDADRDPRPLTTAAAALAVIRTTLRWWSEHGGRGASLRDALDRTFADVVPEGRSR